MNEEGTFQLSPLENQVNATIREHRPDLGPLQDIDSLEYADGTIRHMFYFQYGRVAYQPDWPTLNIEKAPHDLDFKFELTDKKEAQNDS